MNNLLLYCILTAGIEWSKCVRRVETFGSCVYSSYGREGGWVGRVV